ncbi:sodium- and chloride-dependent betaine transporter-like [Cynoglossus semilaevis]|uniref:Sodium- and chloride-dependent betaine transporter-like n=1 Tax=Cynoglossus semilaevis TaxID=244447 RepID=A0A3P8VJZ2_CYNSE|nr:sodium- and chloride-dependent betaine transporter-like [Cynoglossus semilaevis]
MADETVTINGASSPGSQPEKGGSEAGAGPRRKWDNIWEYIFSMSACLLSAPHFWSFPYLMYKNGAVAFLLPYVLIYLVCGIPLLFLEMALGQFTSEGAITAWRKICPMFQGIGFASQITLFYAMTYYIVISAWTGLYLFYSFKSPLVWSVCDNIWNSIQCRTDPDWSYLNNVTIQDNFEDYPYGNTSSTANQGYTAELEFWRYRVIRESEDLSLGVVNWDLALILFGSWTLCFLCTWKGIRLLGKVVYLTVGFSCLLLVIFFFRVVSLPGASLGLKYFFYPSIDHIAQASTWIEAASHVLYSCSASLGIAIALGSYNRYNNNCLRDCLALCGVNFCLNIICTIVVASATGFLAFFYGVELSDVATSDTELIFALIPAALSRIPASGFWSVLFFLMFFCLSIDLQFITVETLATAITDLFPQQLRGPRDRVKLTLLITVVCFLLGLPFVTEGGLLMFHLAGHFCGQECIFLVIAGCEVIVIAWVYGADRFCNNIADMIGFRFPLVVLKYCWLFITPFIILLLLTYYMNLHHGFWYHDYELGVMGKLFGILLTATPLMCIPIFILYTLWKDSKNMLTPSSDLRQALPHKPRLTLCKCVVIKAPATRNVDERNEKIMMGEPSGV